MKTPNRRIWSKLALAAFLAVSAASGVASADGMLARRADLAPAERTALEAQVAAARRANPKAFAAIRQLKGIRPEYYRQLRNPIPEAGRELRRMGPEGLLPMLEALVLDAPPTEGLAENERRALAEGLLSAVGYLRDARASAPVRAIFEKATESWSLRVAGRSMGRLCDAPSFRRLEGSLGEPARRAAAVEGLGECRSLASAEVLARALDAAATSDEATLVANALGNLGSKWAWEALGPSRAAEGQKARERIATALVSSFARHGLSVRDSHRGALGMVRFSDLAKLVAAQRPSLAAPVVRELEDVVRTDARRAR